MQYVASNIYKSKEYTIARLGFGLVRQYVWLGFGLVMQYVGLGFGLVMQYVASNIYKVSNAMCSI